MEQLAQTIMRSDVGKRQLDEVLSSRTELNASIALTNLYNRRGWDKLTDAEEDHCRRYGHSAAVLTCDPDDLKDVNDSKGHAAGDALILRTATAIRNAARTQDTVARPGGDEFGVLAVECDRTGAETLHKRIEAVLNDAGINASIGLALRSPEVPNASRLAQRT